MELYNDKEGCSPCKSRPMAPECLAPVTPTYWQAESNDEDVHCNAVSSLPKNNPATYAVSFKPAL